MVFDLNLRTQARRFIEAHGTRIEERFIFLITPTASATPLSVMHCVYRQSSIHAEKHADEAPRVITERTSHLHQTIKMRAITVRNNGRHINQNLS
ncbi:hypothetical protein XACN24_10375 [Xanthomonas albilineans]|uniref:hypothetical protein n=1 Tax=Xanthomonas albilineans TaxID=29447 RepID=UPI0012D3D27E|nr:hypothetical protein [Xanthomonas albilineans]